VSQSVHGTSAAAWRRRRGATSDWSDAVGTVVFVSVLAWVFALSVALVLSLRREAHLAAGPAPG